MHLFYIPGIGKSIEVAHTGRRSQKRDQLRRVCIYHVYIDVMNYYRQHEIHES